MKLSIGNRSIVLALGVLGALVHVAPASAAATLLHQYRLNAVTGLTDDMGGPSLVSYGGTTGSSAAGGCVAAGAPFNNTTTNTCEGYRFAAGQGLSLSGGLFSADGPDVDTEPDFDYRANYSIVIDYMFDDLTDTDPTDCGANTDLGDPCTDDPGTFSGNGNKKYKVVDYKNLCDGITPPQTGCGSGVYVITGTTPNGRLSYWNSAGTQLNGNASRQIADGMSRVVITRDTVGNIDIYDDGTLAGSSGSFTNIVDALGATFTEPDGIINFFMDDMSTGGVEEGSGFVDTIRIYGGVLTAAASCAPPADLCVGAMNEISDDTFDSSPVPEPGSMLLLGAGLIGVGIKLRRRRAKAKASVA